MSATALDTSVFLDRIERARRAMELHDVDVLLLSVGRDLPYLTGYEAMPLERLTMLVVPRDEPGFWEQLGYHNRGDPWREQRYTGDP